MEYSNFNKNTQAAFTEAFLRSFYNNKNNTMNYNISQDLILTVDSEGEYSEVRKYVPTLGTRDRVKMKIRKYNVFLGHFRLGSIDEEISVAGLDLAENYPSYKRFVISPTITSYESKRSILRYRRHDNFEDCVAMFIALVMGDLGDNDQYDQDDQDDQDDNNIGLTVSEPNEPNEQDKEET